jgi:hypothetical protein
LTTLRTIRPKGRTLDDGRSPDTIGYAVEDGGFFITAEQLARISPDPRQARKDLRMLLADLREPKRIMGPTARPQSVRMARAGDTEPIFELLAGVYRENGHTFAPMDRGKIEGLIQKGIEQKDGVILGVIETLTHGIVATCALMIAQFGWSRQWYLMDVWQCVHPDHRRSRHADDLLDFECWLSDEMTRGFGYQVYLVGGVLSLTRPREKARLFARHMNFIGASFIYPLPPEAAAHG